MTRFLGIVTIVCTLLSGAAQAQYGYHRSHQVLHRQGSQRRWINHAAASGRISHRSARRINNQVHEIKAEAKRYAAAHGGHISRREQARLNHQMRTVRHEVHTAARRHAQHH